MKKSGVFVTFEGIDGAGKTSQVTMLRDWLIENGKKVIVLKGHQLVDEIKKKIISQGEGVDAAAIFFLTMTKHQLVMQRVKQELSENDVVIVDRYIDTSTAYTLGNVDDNEREIYSTMLDQCYKLFLLPKATFLINVSGKEAFRRKEIGKMFDRIEFGYDISANIEEAFVKNQQKAHDNYLEAAKRFSGRFKVIDGEKDKYEIHKNIVKELKSILDSEEDINEAM